MRVPDDVSDSINAYLAFRAVLIAGLYMVLVIMIMIIFWAYIVCNTLAMSISVLQI